MMSSFEVYLLFGVIPAIGGSLFFLLVAAIIFLCVLGFIMAARYNDGYYDNDRRDNGRKEWVRDFNIMKKVGVLSLLLLAVICFVPSQKDMAIIYLAPKIINNQAIQQLPAEVLKFIDKEVSKDD